MREIGDHQGECDLLIRLSHYHCGKGHPGAALVHAQEALDLARKHRFRSEEGSALHVMGDAALASGDGQAAAEHYLAALAVRRRLDDPAEAFESQAGVARARLSLGLIDQATGDVEELLHTWETRGALGLTQPVLSLFTSYRVLAAAQDPRAPRVLEGAYRLLQRCASSIDDRALRHRFLEEVSTNREVAEMWMRRGTEEETVDQLGGHAVDRRGRGENPSPAP